MQRRFYLALLLLSVVARSSFAQVKDAEQHELLVTVNPIQMIDPLEGFLIGVGAEYRISHRFAVYAEGGPYLHHELSWADRSNIRGYLLRGTLKYYLNKVVDEGVPYLGVDYMYKRATFGYADSIQSGNAPAYNKRYTISSYVSCVNFVYGCVKKYNSGLVLEYFVGGGVRFKNATNDLSSAENSGILTGENHGADSGAAERAIGHLVFPNVTFGLRLGYKLL